MAQNYLKKITIEGRADATLKKVVSFLGMANRDSGHKPIADASAALVLKALKKVEATGRYETAHRLRSTAGAVFRYAIVNGLAENDPTYPLRDALVHHEPRPDGGNHRKVRVGRLDAGD